jgi:sRNA-binding protein
MTTRYPREYLENAVRLLAAKYPACFFEDPGMRRPLKAKIIADLQKEGVSEEIIAGVEFYTNHFGYQRCLQAGTDRVDLNGKKAGVVTEQEQRNAQRKIREDKEELGRRNSPILTLRSLHAAGKIPDDQLRKVNVPMKKMAEGSKSAPILARPHMLLASAEEVFAATQDEALRTALTLASLRLLVSEVEKVIAALEAS